MCHPLIIWPHCELNAVFDEYPDTFFEYPDMDTLLLKYSDTGYFENEKVPEYFFGYLSIKLKNVLWK